MMRRPIRELSLLLLVLIAFACGCAGEGAATAAAPHGDPLPLLENASVDEAASWSYRQTIDADLDGDGEDEVLFLTADAETLPDGTPLWDHGHRWAVFVSGSGAGAQPTLLYYGFVPNGHVVVGLLERAADGHQPVLVREHARHREAAFEIAYEAPGRARLVSAAYYAIERWLPGEPVLL